MTVNCYDNSKYECNKIVLCYITEDLIVHVCDVIMMKLLCITWIIIWEKKQKQNITEKQKKKKHTNNIYSRRMIFIFLTLMLKLATKSFHVLTIVIVLHRVFVWVSFDLRLLITHLVSTHFSYVIIMKKIN
jgi:hypothetical protein